MNDQSAGVDARGTGQAGKPTQRLEVETGMVVNHTGEDTILGDFVPERRGLGTGSCGHHGRP